MEESEARTNRYTNQMEEVGWKPPFNTTCQALTWNPQGKRKRGCPRNTLGQDTESELKDNDTTWQEAAKAAQNRVCWRTVIDGLCSSWYYRPKRREMYNYTGRGFRVRCSYTRQGLDLDIHTPHC
jgi:hypothetical protein